MTADLIVPLLVVVGAVIALGRGGGQSLRAFVDEREARRAPLPPARPRIGAEGRAFNPYPMQPRAIEWTEGEIVPERHPEIEGVPVIYVEAREAEPIQAPALRAIDPPRRAIGRGDAGSTDPRSALVWLCGAASVVVVVAKLTGWA